MLLYVHAAMEIIFGLNKTCGMFIQMQKNCETFVCLDIKNALHLCFESVT